MHPQDRTGHRALADLLVGLVQSTARDLAGRPLSAEDEASALEELPPPLIAGNYQRRSSTCLLGRAFEAAVTTQQGFEW